MTATPEERAFRITDAILDLVMVDGENVSASVLHPATDLIAQAIREAIRDELADLAVHIEHAMDTLTDSERQPSVIGAYVRDWAMRPKTPKD